MKTKIFCDIAELNQIKKETVKAFLINNKKSNFKI